jgi:hypothetical protein
MAIGNLLRGSLAETVVRNVPGLGYITNYLSPTNNEPPAYKPNEPWNHSINEDADGNFHIYFQNPHGVPRDDVSLHQDLQALAEYDVSCYGFAETNLDWGQQYVCTDFLQQQWRVWKYATTSFSSIDVESSSDYLTGGTLTSAVGNWSSRVANKEVDPSGMGRWSSLTFVGKRNTKVTVITGYRCVRSNGDGSAWNQEKIFMRDQQSKTNPHPRQHFITDMISFVKEKQCQNHDIILSLDANEVIGEDSAGLSKLIRDCRLSDLLDIPDLDPEEQLKDTFQHGNNRRIDYMLGSQ